MTSLFACAASGDGLPREHGRLSQSGLALDQPFVDEQGFWLAIRNATDQAMPVCVVSWRLVLAGGGGTAESIGGACGDKPEWPLVAPETVEKRQTAATVASLGRPGERVKLQVTLRYEKSNGVADVDLLWQGVIRRYTKR